MTRALIILAAFLAAPVFAQSHLGVPARDHVVLVDELSTDGGCQNTIGQRAFVFSTRLMPDGTQERNFKIPAGKVLVITDFDWTWITGENYNSSILLRLFVNNNNAQDVARSFAPAVLVQFPTGGGSGFAEQYTAVKSEAMTSGFVVTPGVPVCGLVTFGPNQFIFHGTVRGYLDDAYDRDRKK